MESAMMTLSRLHKKLPAKILICFLAISLLTCMVLTMTGYAVNDGADTYGDPTSPVTGTVIYDDEGAQEKDSDNSPAEPDGNYQAASEAAESGEMDSFATQSEESNAGDEDSNTLTIADDSDNPADAQAAPASENSLDLEPYIAFVDVVGIQLPMPTAGTAIVGYATHTASTYEYVDSNVLYTVKNAHALTSVNPGFNYPSATFMGWNTQADGGGFNYAPGDTIDFNTLTFPFISLYAQWAANYGIVYNSNGGNGGSYSEVGINAAKPYTIKNARMLPMSMTGNDFSHWNTLANGRGISYYPGDVVYLAGNLTLYAQWQPTPTCAVVCYWPGIGGYIIDNAPHLMAAVEIGHSYVISSSDDANVARRWWNFDYWNTKENGTGTTYFPYQQITVTECLTLYAVWYQEG